VDDCHALLRLLDAPLRTSGQPALACLLENARRPTVRLWAQGSPFETKEILKARRYRWSGQRRCWYIDLDEAQIEIERTFLSEQVFGRPMPNLPADRLTARDRFSARANPEL
jgi:DNA polymerase-3 subunit epsilon